MKFLVLFFTFLSLFAEKPDLFLLNKYSEDINVTSWYMSEKLDGVRAYWDGEKLVSRSGKVFSSPEFFTKDFPKFELDGELWSKRGGFSNISSIVNQKKPHIGWKNLTYNVFEVPNADGDLLQRVHVIKSETKYLKIIKQIKVKNREHLNDFLKNVEKKGGEGVVVRDASIEYYTGRNKNALKVKTYVDEECEIVGYNKGKGKYIDVVGSFLCKTASGLLIKIGTGLSDSQRAYPPKIGAIITFKYYGLTSKGKPRFPVFLREREN